MKVGLKLFLVAVFAFSLPSQAWWLVSSSSAAESNTPPANDKMHNDWLKKRFSKQHQQLIPIVAVADIFYSCNKARRTDKISKKNSRQPSSMTSTGKQCDALQQTYQ